MAGTKHFSQNKSGGVTSTNLNEVTSATNGPSLGTRDFIYKSIFINVSINTGAVTVNIEASHNGFTWFNIRSITYTAQVQKDLFSYTSHFPFMRTTTTTHSNATVTTEITGGN